MPSNTTWPGASQDSAHCAQVHWDSREKIVTLLPQSSPTVPDFLVWGDIRLERLQGPGSFMLHLQIRNLKTNSLMNGEKATQNTKLNFRIRTPSLADNLLYSIPHRLLVIGLRLCVSDDVADLNDLIHGSQQNILIKPAFLNVAVFLRSSPGGRTLTDQPMFAYSFTTYLSEHGQRIGYKDKITLYSFRRRTLSD